MADDHGLLAKWKLAQSASTDSRLSRGDLAVLIQILDQMRDGEAWPGLGHIAKETRLDRSSVVRSVKRLDELGYLLRKSGDRSRSNRYRMGPGLRRIAAPRRKAAPRVGASSHLDLDAGSHPKPAHKNPPSKTHDASRPAGLWTDGIRLLTEAGTSREDAGATIGRLRKQLGEDEASAVVTHMLAVRPTGPKSYLYGVMNKRRNARTSHDGRLARDNRTEDELASANEEALARLGATT